MRTAFCWLLTCVVFAATGCGHPTPSDADDGETLVLYSLDPWDWEGEPLGAGEMRFGRRTVLGSTTVADPRLRQEIVAAVRDGMDKADQTGFAQCKFMPRHGLHHIAKNGTVTDTLICFECQQVSVTVNGERLKWERDGPMGRELAGIGNITRGPQKLLNKVLTDVGVKLDPGATKGE